VAKAIPPDYALGNDVASLGLAFTQGDLLPLPFRNGAFIGEHGSWNRILLSGYKVVFVPFSDGNPSGQPVDVLTGFSYRGRRSARAACRRCHGSKRCAACRRRCRQCRVARDVNG